MTEFRLPRIEDLDVDDLALLPTEYRYELHGGNLVIRTPSAFGHKLMARRLVQMLCAAGLEAFQDTGVRGDRPRDLADFSHSVRLSELEIEYRAKHA